MKSRKRENKMREHTVDVLRYVEMWERTMLDKGLRMMGGMVELVADGVWRVKDGTALVKLKGRCEVKATEYSVFPVEVEVIEGALQPMGSAGSDPSGYTFEPVMPSKSFHLSFFAETEMWERGKTGLIIVSYLRAMPSVHMNDIDWAGVKYRLKSEATKIGGLTRLTGSWSRQPTIEEHLT